jgi:O-antigen/teichoic acid export membrane protein
MRGAFEPVTSSLVAPALARHDAAGLGVAIQRQTRWLALIVFPLAAVLIGFGDPLLAVFGHGFTAGVPALAVLAIGHVANALALSSFVLPLSGNGRYTTYVAVSTLVVQTILCFVLVPRFGILGAAIALASGLVFAQTAQIVLAARVVGVRGVSPELFVVAACAVGALGAGRALFHVLHVTIVLRFATSLALAAVVYAIAAWAFAIEREDRNLALGALRRVRLLW